MSRAVGKYLLVLAVLTGLFAMHALTANHDMAMLSSGSTLHHRAATAEWTTAEWTTAAGEAAQAEASAPPAPMVPAGTHGGLGGDHLGLGTCMGILVAILLAAVVRAVRRAGSRLVTILRHTTAHPSAIYRERWRSRSLCPSLTELSISRT